jgi:hypothetical protein
VKDKEIIIQGSFMFECVDLLPVCLVEDVI